MKATIENGIEKPTPTKGFAMMEIVNAVTSSQTEEALRASLREVFVWNYVQDNFEYGFGHNHVWVMDRDSKKRVLFAEF